MRTPAMSTQTTHTRIQDILYVWMFRQNVTRTRLEPLRRRGALSANGRAAADKCRNYYFIFVHVLITSNRIWVKYHVVQQTAQPRAFGEIYIFLMIAAICIRTKCCFKREPDQLWWDLAFVPSVFIQRSQNTRAICRHSSQFRCRIIIRNCS